MIMLSDFDYFPMNLKDHYERTLIASALARAQEVGLEIEIFAQAFYEVSKGVELAQALGNAFWDWDC